MSDTGVKAPASDYADDLRWLINSAKVASCIAFICGCIGFFAWTLDNHRMSLWEVALVGGPSAVLIVVQSIMSAARGQHVEINFWVWAGILGAPMSVLLIHSVKALLWGEIALEGIVAFNFAYVGTRVFATLSFARWRMKRHLRRILG